VQNSQKNKSKNIQNLEKMH